MLGAYYCQQASIIHQELAHLIRNTYLINEREIYYDYELFHRIVISICYKRRYPCHIPRGNVSNYSFAMTSSNVPFFRQNFPHTQKNKVAFPFKLNGI